MTTALTDLVAQRRTETSAMKQANAAIYDMVLAETAQMLHGTPQMAQDVLHQVCVEHNVRPQDVLMLVHDFLEMFAQFQQYDTPTEQAENSPYMMREEG